MSFDYTAIIAAVWQGVEPLLANVTDKGKDLARAELTQFAARAETYIASFLTGKPYSLDESKLWLQDEIDHARGVLGTVQEIGWITAEQVAAKQGEIMLDILAAIPKALGL